MTKEFQFWTNERADLARRYEDEQRETEEALRPLTQEIERVKHHFLYPERRSLTRIKLNNQLAEYHQRINEKRSVVLRNDIEIKASIKAITSR